MSSIPNAPCCECRHSSKMRLENGLEESGSSAEPLMQHMSPLEKCLRRHAHLLVVLSHVLMQRRTAHGNLDGRQTWARDFDGAVVQQAHLCGTDFVPDQRICGCFRMALRHAATRFANRHPPGASGGSRGTSSTPPALHLPPCLSACNCNHTCPPAVSGAASWRCSRPPVAQARPPAPAPPPGRNHCRPLQVPAAAGFARHTAACSHPAPKPSCRGGWLQGIGWLRCVEEASAYRCSQVQICLAAWGADKQLKHS